MEKILGMRRRENPETLVSEDEYLIKWKGYSYVHCNWMKAHELATDTYSRMKVQRFHKKWSALPAPIDADVPPPSPVCAHAQFALMYYAFVWVCSLFLCIRVCMRTALLCHAWMVVRLLGLRILQRGLLRGRPRVLCLRRWCATTIPRQVALNVVRRSHLGVCRR